MRLLIKTIKFIKRKILAAWEATKYWCFYPLGRLKYANKEIYLISERGVDARDNGYWFFRYLRTRQPHKEAYFVLSKKSPDYKKVADLGNVVRYRSLKHYLLFIGAKYKISTHIMGFSPNMSFYNSFNWKHRIKGKLVFLQHGVIINNLTGVYQEKTKIDLFVCGAQPEYEYIKKEFHYTGNEVVYTGLARYDGLHDIEIKKQILIMPTWRVYLKTLNKKALPQSDYFKHWNGVLTNRDLINELEKNNINLVFYPHYEMQPYIKGFHTVSPRIKIAEFKKYDVQTLLKESAFLVTDYSSIFFDFAYMQKPLAYYQFDFDKFTKEHYKQGYFDYNTAGFGPVFKTESELVEYLVKKITDGFAQDDCYKARCKDFFPLRDQNNCQRIFEEIAKL